VEITIDEVPKKVITMKRIQTIYLTLLLLGISAIITPVLAQQTGSIQGTITDSDSGQPLPGVNIIIKGTTVGVSSDIDGSYMLKNVSTAKQKVVFSFVGYQKQVHTVSISSGEISHLSVTMHPKELMMTGISVTALRPDLNVNAKMKQAEVRKANPRDSGELLRSANGVNAVRRGPVGLDPVVRGLRESEVGTYLNGSRIFPAGPARMDSPLSHLDPTAIKSIDIVKGPYALTWGAGNMSAIRVQTQQLKTLTQTLSGNVSSGYDTNFNAFEESAALRGNSSKFGYMLSGAWRKGNDYTSGNGTLIQGDYLSREIRGKVGYATTSNSWLKLSLGYQNQKNLDYPGRLLNARFFHTYNAALDWEWHPENSIITSIKAKAYINNVDHQMDNKGKPTAKPNPNRMPPFALDVTVNSKVNVTGGRIDAHLSTADSWNWEVGADIYSAYRNATRYIRRKDNQMLMFQDFMWPQATVTDGGIFTRGSHSFGDKWSANATVRLDLVSARADTASPFFRQNVSTNLSSNEVNISASGTVNYNLAENWTLGLGLGSVVRTAQATERYSDRIPASKAQMSAEFVGNPDLKPERSTQADLWINAAYANWDLSFNVFARQMANYITLKPTNFPKRLPLSPNTVYKYINGSARFWGFDFSADFQILPPLQLTTSVNYLWAQDTKINEPALGISPFEFDPGLRYEFQQWPVFMEGTVHFVSKQTRVATARGETPTDGYTTIDLLAGGKFWQKISLQLGVKNVTNRQYVNHLNAKNPFTGMPIPEPGRIIYGDVSIRF